MGEPSNLDRLFDPNRQEGLNRNAKLELVVAGGAIFLVLMCAAGLLARESVHNLLDMAGEGINAVFNSLPVSPP